MPSAAAALLPALAFLASTAGAGWAASRLFGQLRAALPCPTAAEWPRMARPRRLAATLLYAPRYARLTVFALSAAVSLAATGAAAALAGQDARPALDAALAVIVSQLVHAGGLSDRPSAE